MSLTTQLLDSDLNEIENNTLSDLKFNADTGKFESLDGDSTW